VRIGLDDVVAGRGGKERDEESGLYYHGARSYAPSLGRWTACDPKWLVEGPNDFAYVRNNPVRLRDPTGNDGEPGLWDSARAFARENVPVQLALGVAYGTAQAVVPLGFLAPSPAPHSQAFEYGRGAGQIAGELLAIGQALWIVLK
jgi:RHS repeat-associated protein